MIVGALARCHSVVATGQVLDERDDAALIAAVRGGDTAAYGVLFGRHVDAARRLARSLASPDGPADADDPGDPGDPEDLVAQAFADLLPPLLRGAGPEVAFRPHLLTAVRRAGGCRRPSQDTAVTGPVARAFASLPERWQLVLWHTSVEGQRPAAVAPLVGLSPHATSQLADRAREGLLLALVTVPVREAGARGSSCRSCLANLRSYVGAGHSGRQTSRTSAHLECCRPCTAVYLALVEADRDLSALLASSLLAGAAPAYLADVETSLAAQGPTAVSDVLGTRPGRALAGAAVSGLLVTALALGGTALVGSGDGEHGAVADTPAATTRQPTADGGTAGPAGPPSRPRPARDPAPVRAVPAVATTAATTTPTDHTPADHATTHQTGSHDEQASWDGNAGHEAPQPAPPDPNQVDLRPLASRAGIGPAAMVTVSLTGLSPAQQGVVTVTTDRPAATVGLDPRCELTGVGTARCQLPGDASLQLLAASPLVPTTLTITVAPGAGLTDRSTDDNTVQVVLGA